MTVNELTKNFLKSISGRQRDILNKRFGLTDNKGATLAAIGDEYQLTRERIRQIEGVALSAIKKEFGNHSDFRKIVDLVLAHLEQKGSLIKEKAFLDAIRQFLKERISDNYLKLILAIIEDVDYHFEDADVYDFWYLRNNNRIEEFFDFVNRTEKFLSKLRRVIIQKEFEKFLAQVAKDNDLSATTALNYFDISKKFGFNHYGDFGLSEWPEINLKTAGAKAHLILKKYGKPMHFKDISKKMADFKNGRRVMYQTVHNELIKNSHFILVGRGMYGLAEFGLKPGFVKDVIVRILKTHGPLTKNKIVNLVKKERVLKDNTIAINLHNRKNFRRLPDGRYTLVIPNQQQEKKSAK